MRAALNLLQFLFFVMENPFEIINERLERIESLLNQIINKKDIVNNTIVNEIMTVKEVADYLSLSVPTIYGLNSKREIPCMKRGKRLYFNKTEINDWLMKSRKKTMDEIQQEAMDYIATRKRKY